MDIPCCGFNYKFISFSLALIIHSFFRFLFLPLISCVILLPYFVFLLVYFICLCVFDFVSSWYDIRAWISDYSYTHCLGFDFMKSGKKEIKKKKKSFTCSSSSTVLPLACVCYSEFWVCVCSLKAKSELSQLSLSWSVELKSKQYSFGGLKVEE